MIDEQLQISVHIGEPSIDRRADFAAVVLFAIAENLFQLPQHVHLRNHAIVQMPNTIRRFEKVPVAVRIKAPIGNQNLRVRRGRPGTPPVNRDRADAD